MVFDGSEVPLEERTAEDYAHRMAACMRGLGWQAEAVGPPDNTWRVVYDIAPEQDSEFREATRECDELIGYAGPLEFSTEQLETMYERGLEIKECLEGEGYDISEPHSLEVFVDSNAGWNPYNDVALEDDSTRAALTELCRPHELASAE